MRQQVRYTYRGSAHQCRLRYEKRLALRGLPKSYSRVVVSQGNWSVETCACEDSEVTVLHDWKARYYWRANQGGTWHAELIDSMIKLQQIDDGMVDMVGCNSPQRGLFKRQFGGYLTPYYCVTTLDPRDIAEFWAPPAEAAVA